MYAVSGSKLLVMEAFLHGWAQGCSFSACLMVFRRVSVRCSFTNLQG